MTIQKKSLISKLNTTKKAIVASTPATGVSTSETRTNARAEGRLSKAAVRHSARTSPRWSTKRK